MVSNLNIVSGILDIDTNNKRPAFSLFNTLYSPFTLKLRLIKRSKLYTIKP